MVFSLIEFGTTTWNRLTAQDDGPVTIRLDFDETSVRAKRLVNHEADSAALQDASCATRQPRSRHGAESCSDSQPGT